MNLLTLKGIVADLYPDPTQMRDLARRSGLPSKHIRLTDTPAANANSIIIAAKASGFGGIPRLARTAADDFPNHPWLRAYAWGQDVPEGKVDIADVWKAPREVITTDHNTIYPFEWLSEGIKAGAPVVRVDIAGKGYGSGIVLDGIWLVTNNHVLPDTISAVTARIEFNYEKSRPQFHRQKLSPSEGFITDPALDITICCIGSSHGPVVDYPLSRIRAPILGHFCQIIGHPAGDYKHVSAYNNGITYVEDNSLQYLTSTLPGSSGSPVFDEEWNLIGIHHSGGWLNFPDNRYANQGTPAQRIVDLMERMDIHGT